MPLLAVTNLSYSIGDLHILDEVSLSIEPGDRIGLVGRNGAGKSTLMKIIAGQLKADSGQSVLLRGRKVAYLMQDPIFNQEETLRGEAEAAFADLHRLHRELDHIYEQLALPENAAPEPMQRLLDEQIKLETAMEIAGGYDVGHKIDAILHGLGFEDKDFSLPVRGLSGGQRGRLALAKLLLEGPDLLLLDEPTNHLDIAGREWLEEFLANEYKGAVLVVSHDRYLLDRVVTRIVEVEDCRLIDYPGSYDDFREQRDLRRLTMQRAYEKQQTKFKAEEAYIRRYKAGQRAKQAKGRETRLDREKLQNKLERPTEFANLSMELPKAPRSGDLVVQAVSVTKSYPNAEGGPDRVLFDEFNLKIGRGERWGIIGPNGTGKTTLMKCILGDVPLDSGNARLGASVIVGHYRQIEDAFDPDAPVFQFLQTVIRKENPAASLSEQAARNLAGAFLFSGDDQGKRMGVLSGGERSRARLAALLASGKNLLILDEPTNHLDIPSAERLEQALLPVDDGGTFDGTLILISHDRALIDATCDNLIVFDGHGGVSTFAGNYSEWHEAEKVRIAEAAARARPAPAGRGGRSQAEAKPKQPERAAAAAAPAAPRPAKQSQRPSKQSSNHPKNSLSWLTVPKLEAKLEESQTRLKQLDTELADPEVYRDKSRCNRLLDERAAAASALAELEAEWLRRAESV